MIKKLLILSIMIINLNGAAVYDVKDHPQKPFNPKITITETIQMLCSEILQLNQIKTPTAKALLRERNRKLRELLNEQRK